MCAGHWGTIQLEDGVNGDQCGGNMEDGLMVTSVGGTWKMGLMVTSGVNGDQWGKW